MTDGLSHNNVNKNYLKYVIITVLARFLLYIQYDNINNKTIILMP